MYKIYTLNFFLLLFVFCCFKNTAAQQPVHHPFKDEAPLLTGPGPNICGTDMALYQLRKNPAYRAMEEKMNLAIRNAMDTLSGDTIILPVVVHVVNPNPYSITDAQVIAGINLLNDAFSKSGIYAASPGADTKIRFCMSKKDPDGGNTTGITRTTSYFGNHLNKDIEDRKLKNLIQWDPVKYINIWLITSIDAEAYINFSCGVWTRLGVGGYATLPPGGGPLDGIVITGFGALLAHEMGHYLGLYHTFEGGCYNYDCLLNGDRVCDTPPDNSVRPSPACNNPGNSCNTDTLSNYSNGNFFTDVPDQITNFMDYGNSGCSIQFTQGQADRMRAAVMTQRSGLLQDECTQPCIENIIAAFTRDIAYPVTGDLINFTNTSTGAASFEWLVNDVVIATTTNFSYSFTATGKTKVTLKAFNTPGCFAAYSDFIITNCGVTARFYTNKKTIASKLGILTDSIVFTNSSYNGITYQWLMSNDQGMAEQVISTSTNITYVFPTPANYTMRLVATNGSCSDTTDTYIIPVWDPTADGAFFNVAAYCYQQTKVKVNFCVVDWGIAPIPINTPINFYDADPHLPGANKLSPTFYMPYTAPGGNCYTCYSTIINVGYAHLDKLYMVFADSGNAVPVVLPNTSFIEKDYNNNFYTINNLRFRANATPVTATLLPGDTLQLNATGLPAAPGFNAFLWSTAYRLSCTTCSNPYLYADSDRIKRVIVTSPYGCIDTAYVDIRVPPADDYTISINNVICASHDSMNVNFTVYNSFIRGVIPKNLEISFYNGNPTIAGASLLFPVYKVADTTFARQQSFSTRIKIMPQGNLYAVVNDSSLLIPISLPNTPRLEKDYTNNMHTVFYQPNQTTVNAAICQGQNYAGHYAAGIYVDTLAGYNGCDSIRTLNLTVKPVFFTTVTTSICPGQNYAGHTISGTYIDVYPAINGCDSTRTLNLTVLPVIASTVNAAICPGQNYAGYTMAGTYIDVYTAANGCDSTRTLNLSIKPTASSNIVAVICQDDNYAGHTTSGTYIDIYPAANGCDSTRTLQLTVNPKAFTTVNAAICNGETYLAGGQLQTTAGVYKDTLTTYLGCDSVITTNLTVNPLPAPDLGKDRGICFGDVLVLNPGSFVTYLWQNGSTNNTYSTNLVGQYSVLVTNNFGCKKSDTMKLTKIFPLPANYMPADTSLCRGNIVHVKIPGYINYLWSTGGTQNFIDIIKTGTYTLDVTDKNGCKGTDSVKIFYYNCADVWIPNSFTPNRDGLNDVFRPVFPAPVTNYRMQIWNRWGFLVFESRSSAIGWDGSFKGEQQQLGVYVYVVTFTDIDGADVKKTGTIMLIR